MMTQRERARWEQDWHDVFTRTDDEQSLPVAA
jgi:hypothetical protein